MIHKFKKLGYNIALDVNSGGVHIMDDCAFKILDYISLPMEPECPEEIFSKMPEYTKSETAENYNELYQLYKEGALFSEDDYDKYGGLSIKAPIKSICLNVAHDCNLRCEYCFAQTGDFGGERCLMTPETGKKAIDFLIQNSGDRETLELDFFGGEPLMAWNTVTAVVDYARSKEKETGKTFRFTVTTNGVLLTDDKIDYINKEMHNVVLSLDGRREVTDRVRKTLNGKSCYDLIVPKFQKLVEKRGDKDYYVRATFTKYNLDFASDILALRDLGFEQLSAEPVATDPNMPFAIKEEDLPRVFDEYDRLCKIMSERKEKKFNFFHFMIDLNGGPCVVKRLRGCGCGNDYCAVDPKGDIYPCHQFVGMERWKMGTLDTGITRPDIRDYFSKVHVYSKESCRNCWAKFFCSGGCSANGFLYAGDVMKPYAIGCEMQKKRLECALALAVDKAVKEDENV